MIYEPTRHDGESSVDRLSARAPSRVNRSRLAHPNSDEEWAQVDHHVTTCDYPETTTDTWLALGRDGGLSAAREIFLRPDRASTAVYRYDR